MDKLLEDVRQFTPAVLLYDDAVCQLPAVKNDAMVQKLSCEGALLLAPVAAIQTGREACAAAFAGVRAGAVTPKRQIAGGSGLPPSDYAFERDAKRLRSVTTALGLLGDLDGAADGIAQLVAAGLFVEAASMAEIATAPSSQTRLGPLSLWELCHLQSLDLSLEPVELHGADVSASTGASPGAALDGEGAFWHSAPGERESYLAVSLRRPAVIRAVCLTVAPEARAASYAVHAQFVDSGSSSTSGIDATASGSPWVIIGTAVPDEGCTRVIIPTKGKRLSSTIRVVLRSASPWNALDRVLHWPCQGRGVAGSGPRGVGTHLCPRSMTGSFALSHSVGSLQVYATSGSAADHRALSTTLDGPSAPSLSACVPLIHNTRARLTAALEATSPAKADSGRSGLDRTQAIEKAQLRSKLCIMRLQLGVLTGKASDIFNALAGLIITTVRQQRLRAHESSTADTVLSCQHLFHAITAICDALSAGSAPTLPQRLVSPRIEGSLAPLDDVESPFRPLTDGSCAIIESKFCPELSPGVAVTCGGIAARSSLRFCSAVVPLAMQLSTGSYVCDFRLVEDRNMQECVCFGLTTLPVTGTAYDATSSSLCVLRAFNGRVYVRGHKLEHIKLDKVHPNAMVRIVFDTNVGVVGFSINGVWQGVAFSVGSQPSPSSFHFVSVFYSSGRRVDLAGPILHFRKSLLAARTCSPAQAPTGASSPSRTSAAVTQTAAAVVTGDALIVERILDAVAPALRSSANERHQSAPSPLGIGSVQRQASRGGFSLGPVIVAVSPLRANPPTARTGPLDAPTVIPHARVGPPVTAPPVPPRRRLPSSTPTESQVAVAKAMEWSCEACTSIKSIRPPLIFLPAMGTPTSATIDGTPRNTETPRYLATPRTDFYQGSDASPLPPASGRQAGVTAVSLACKICTFINTVIATSMVSCEMCGAALEFPAQEEVLHGMDQPHTSADSSPVSPERTDASSPTQLADLEIALPDASVLSETVGDAASLMPRSLDRIGEVLVKMHQAASAVNDLLGCELGARTLAAESQEHAGPGSTTLVGVVHVMDDWRPCSSVPLCLDVSAKGMQNLELLIAAATVSMSKLSPACYAAVLGLATEHFRLITLSRQPSSSDSACHLSAEESLEQVLLSLSAGDPPVVPRTVRWVTKALFSTLHAELAGLRIVDANTLHAAYELLTWGAEFILPSLADRLVLSSTALRRVCEAIPSYNTDTSPDDALKQRRVASCSVRIAVACLRRFCNARCLTQPTIPLGCKSMSHLQRLAVAPLSLTVDNAVALCHLVTGADVQFMDAARGFSVSLAPWWSVSRGIVTAAWGVCVSDDEAQADLVHFALSALCQALDVSPMPLARILSIQESGVILLLRLTLPWVSARTRADVASLESASPLWPVHLGSLVSTIQLLWSALRDCASTDLTSSTPLSHACWERAANLQQASRQCNASADDDASRSISAIFQNSIPQIQTGISGKFSVLADVFSSLTWALCRVIQRCISSAPPITDVEVLLGRWLNSPVVGNLFVNPASCARRDCGEVSAALMMMSSETAEIVSVVEQNLDVSEFSNAENRSQHTPVLAEWLSFISGLSSASAQALLSWAQSATQGSGLRRRRQQQQLNQSVVEGSDCSVASSSSTSVAAEAMAFFAVCHHCGIGVELLSVSRALAAGTTPAPPSECIRMVWARLASFRAWLTSARVEVAQSFRSDDPELSKSTLQTDASDGGDFARPSIVGEMSGKVKPALAEPVSSNIFTSTSSTSAQAAATLLLKSSASLVPSSVKDLDAYIHSRANFLLSLVPATAAGSSLDTSVLSMISRECMQFMTGDGLCVDLDMLAAAKHLCHARSELLQISLKLTALLGGCDLPSVGCDSSSLARVMLARALQSHRKRELHWLLIPNLDEKAQGAARAIIEGMYTKVEGAVFPLFSKSLAPHAVSLTRYPLSGTGSESSTQQFLAFAADYVCSVSELFRAAQSFVSFPLASELAASIDLFELYKCWAISSVTGAVPERASEAIDLHIQILGVNVKSSTPLQVKAASTAIQLAVRDAEAALRYLCSGARSSDDTSSICFPVLSQAPISSCPAEARLMEMLSILSQGSCRAWLLHAWDRKDDAAASALCALIRFCTHGPLRTRRNASALMIQLFQAAVASSGSESSLDESFLVEALRASLSFGLGEVNTSASTTEESDVKNVAESILGQVSAAFFDVRTFGESLSDESARRRALTPTDSAGDVKETAVVGAGDAVVSAAADACRVYRAILEASELFPVIASIFIRVCDEALAISAIRLRLLAPPLPAISAEVLAGTLSTIATGCAACAVFSGGLGMESVREGALVATDFASQAGSLSAESLEHMVSSATCGGERSATAALSALAASVGSLLADPAPDAIVTGLRETGGVLVRFLAEGGSACVTPTSDRVQAPLHALHRAFPDAVASLCSASARTTPSGHAQRVSDAQALPLHTLAPQLPAMDRQGAVLLSDTRRVAAVLALLREAENCSAGAAAAAWTCGGVARVALLPAATASPSSSSDPLLDTIAVRLLRLQCMHASISVLFRAVSGGPSATVLNLLHKERAVLLRLSLLTLPLSSCASLSAIHGHCRALRARRYEFRCGADHALNAPSVSAQVVTKPTSSRVRDMAVSLGFSEALCRKALELNRDDPDRAAEWLLGGQAESFIRGGGMDTAAAAVSGKATATQRWAVARELALVVGAPPALAHRALEMLNDNRDTASAWLLDHAAWYTSAEAQLARGWPVGFAERMPAIAGGDGAAAADGSGCLDAVPQGGPLMLTGSGSDGGRAAAAVAGGQGATAGAAGRRMAAAAAAAPSDAPLPLSGCLEAVVGRAVTSGNAGLPVRPGALVCRGQAVGPAPSFAAAGLLLRTVRSVAPNQQSAEVAWVDPRTGMLHSETVAADELRVLLRLYDHAVGSEDTDSDQAGGAGLGAGSVGGAVAAALGRMELAAATYMARRLLLGLLILAPVLASSSPLGGPPQQVMPPEAAVQLVKRVISAEGLLDSLTGGGAAGGEGGGTEDESERRSALGPPVALAGAALSPKTPSRRTGSARDAARGAGAPGGSPPASPGGAPGSARSLPTSSRGHATPAALSLTPGTPARAEAAPAAAMAALSPSAGGDPVAAGGAARRAVSPLVTAVDAVVRVLVSGGGTPAPAAAGSSSSSSGGGGASAWSALVRECASCLVASTRPPAAPTPETAQIFESLHPYYQPCAYADSIRVEGSKGLSIAFDAQCSLGPETELILGTSWGGGAVTEARRITGPAPAHSPAWAALSCLHADTLHYQFMSRGTPAHPDAPPARDEWGFRVAVSPLRGLQWLNEAQAASEPSLNFGLWLLALLAGAPASSGAAAAAAVAAAPQRPGGDLALALHSPLIYGALAVYLLAPGAPLKDRVVDALTQLLGLLAALPRPPALGGGAEVAQLRKIGAAVWARCTSEASSGHVLLPVELQHLAEMALGIDVALARIDGSSAAPRRFDPATDVTTSTSFMFVKRIALRVPVAPRLADASLIAFDRMSKAALLRCALDLADALALPARLPDPLVHAVAARASRAKPDDRRLMDIVLTNVAWAAHEDAQLLDWARAVSRAQHTDLEHLDAGLLDAPACVPKRSDALYGLLAHHTTLSLQIRFATLQVLNDVLARCLELVDTSRPAAALWTLASRLRRIDALVFPDCRGRLVEAAVQATRIVSAAPQYLVRLDNALAFQSFDAGVTDAGLSNCLFIQCWRQLHLHAARLFRHVPDERERLFFVEFVGEAGLDWGGIYRDAMTRAVDDLFNGHLDLFLPCRNATAVGGTRANADRWVPNPKYAQPSPRISALYSFVGSLMGLSLRQRLYLGFPLAGLVWRGLCGEAVDLAAVAEVDQPAVDCIAAVERTLAAPSSASGSGAGSGTTAPPPAAAAAAPLGRVFVIPGADGADVELVPGGRAMAVSPENAAQFVALATQFKAHEFDRQLDAMRAGLAAVIPPRAITLCTAAGLELRVCGDPHVDIEALKAHTVYNGYFKNDRVPTLFWRVLSSFDDEQRGRFVRFAWGRSRLPLSHQRWEREFRLSRADGRGDESLPLAHTCFFHVELPAYSSEAIMRTRLLATINYGLDAYLMA